MFDEPSVVDVIVDDPKSEGFGPSKHTTYRISCSSHGVKPSVCRHRFSDFEKLREQLLELCPGCVIPPLPVKQILGKYADDLVEKRRDLLELFLQQVVAHPIASVCDAFHSFLSLSEATRTAVVQRAKRFELPPTPAAYETGDPLNEGCKLLAEFEKQIGAVRERFKRLQSRQGEDAMDLHELSQSIKTMGENPLNMVLNCALPPFTDGCQKLASHTKRQAQNTKQTFLPKLKLYKQMAVAMQEQIKRRSAISTNIEATNAKTKELLGQSTKLAGRPGKEKKVGDLESQAAELQQRVARQKELFDQVTRTLAWEFERYNANKNRDMLAALQNYAISFADFTTKEHEMWDTIASGVVSRVNKVTYEATALAAGFDANKGVMKPATMTSSAAEPPPPAPPPPVLPRGPNSTDQMEGAGAVAPAPASQVSSPGAGPSQSPRASFGGSGEAPNPFAETPSNTDNHISVNPLAQNPFAQPSNVGSFF